MAEATPRSELEEACMPWGVLCALCLTSLLLERGVLLRRLTHSACSACSAVIPPEMVVRPWLSRRATGTG